MDADHSVTSCLYKCLYKTSLLGRVVCFGFRKTIGMEALECYYPHPPRRGGSLHRGLLRSAISPTFMAGFVRATMPMTVKMVRVHAECYCGGMDVASHS